MRKNYFSLAKVYRWPGRSSDSEVSKTLHKRKSDKRRTIQCCQLEVPNRGLLLACFGHEMWHKPYITVFCSAKAFIDMSFHSSDISNNAIIPLLRMKKLRVGVWGLNYTESIKFKIWTQFFKLHIAQCPFYWLTADGASRLSSTLSPPLFIHSQNGKVLVWGRRGHKKINLTFSMLLSQMLSVNRPAGLFF